MEISTKRKDSGCRTGRQCRYLLLLLLLSGVPTLPAQAHSSYASLREGFAHTPQPAKLRCYWWWLNGNTDKATITSDLEEMARMGFGGALLIDANGSDQTGNKGIPAGPTFGSPEWTQLYVHALREADRLNLEISLNITTGWNLGGPRVKPEQASKVLTWSRISVTGGKPISMDLPSHPIKNGYYREIAVLAYPLHHGTALAQQVDDRQDNRHTETGVHRSDSLRFRSAAAESGGSMPDTSSMLNPGPNPTDRSAADTALSEVRDIRSSVQDQHLDWSAPAGEWEVLRIGYTDSDARVSTSSGTWQGLAIDYLDHTAFDSYWNDTVEPLLVAGKPYLGRSLKYLVSDSWELGGANWTPQFRQHFLQLRGYDPLPYLPVVAGRIVQDRDVSTRFLTDLRRTVADLIVTEHYDVFAEHARRYGLGIHPESGGPHGAPLDALETFRSSTFPQTEYWAPNAHRPTDVDRFFTKEGASAMNIYGLPFNAQEGMTSIGPQWSERLATDLKPAFDRALTEGMTRLVWHQFTASPKSTGLPGQEFFAGTHLNPKVTWWPVAGAFFAYLNRSQFMLQQGTSIDDVLYYYGDNVPNFVRVKSADPAGALPGYDYDVTNEDALLHHIRSESGELIGPKGMRWRLLMLPRTRRMSMRVVQVVERFVRAGGVVAGLPPISPTGQTTTAEQAEYDATVRRVWQDCQEGESRHYGKGTVFCETSSRHVLHAMSVAPDFSSTSTALDYIHRRVGDTDVYFVRNGSAEAILSEVTFRVRKAPELWDAVTGEIIAAPSYYAAGANATGLHLNLPAYGSVFVVFRSERIAPQRAGEERTATVPVPLAPSWQIRFAAGRGAPTTPVKVSELRSWTDSKDAGIRYFSGTAIYSNTFVLSNRSKLSPLTLRLHDLHEIARVRVNGHDAGTIWALPFELKIASGLLRSGVNRLEIEVTNLWPNRIIGDLQPRATERYTRTNITAYKADSKLLPSGLIGPVTLERHGGQ